MTTHLIGPELAGVRLDQAVARLESALSRSYAQELIAEGHVRVNDRPAKASLHLKTGDRVTVEIPPATPIALTAEPIPLTVVYEDADVLVIDKPAGLVVHPAPGHAGGTLVNALLAHTADLSLHGDIRPGIVHRLDKDTSGLLVVAKHDTAHAALVRQHQARTMRKEYLALVLGTPAPAGGLIDAPIGRHPRERKRQAVIPEGRPARTHYTTERAYGHLTLVRARLETGRTHQIRVHFAFIGHPIIGDPVYGQRATREAHALGLTRQFLHATRLGFHLPGSGAWREFESPLPPDLAAALARLEAGDTAGAAQTK